MVDDPLNPVTAHGSADSTSAPAVDAALIERVSAGDKEAMAGLFDRYAGLVYSIAFRVLKDEGHAEDLMQEVFFQFWRKPGAFVSGRGSLGAWLAVVARNRAIDVLRQRKPSDPVEEVVLLSNTNLASEVERSRMVDKVRSILSGLPSEQQQSVELAFFEGLSHTEIAARTGDPLGTVKSRIRTALGSIRKAVQA
jgi:RNA polymerase sigma-70 factor, ECF subfamily